MSISSTYVKTWRQNVKKRMVQALGGKCIICGYDHCMEAMDFHHIDPSEKDFGLGSTRANIKSWDSIVSEIKKCVLLCARCHREVHAGIIAVPEIIPTFDPIWEDYRNIGKLDLEPSYCPVCNTKKRPEAKHCSLRCAGITNRKVNWDDYDINEMIKTMSKADIGRMLGVSDVAVHKRLKKMAQVSGSRVL